MTADRDGALGVLLLHMGGPRDLAEVRPFLQRLFADPDMIRMPGPLRVPLAAFIATTRAAAARRRYALMGGGSPAVAQVTALGAALEAQLRASAATADACVEPAFLYCGQDAAAALARLRERGARPGVAVPEYPQFSATTTGASLKALDRALRAQPGAAVVPSDLPRVTSWCDAPLFADLWEETIRRTLAQRFPAGARPYLLFSAHGLPVRYVRAGDPYEQEIRRSAAAIAARFPDLEHGLAFQSRFGPVRWLGPDVVGEVRRLAAAGARDLLVAPISFLTDHVETLVELDIELAHVARAAGVTGFARSGPAAASPLAARALAFAVRVALDDEVGPPREGSGA